MTVLTWSEDRVEQLKKLWEAGLSASQIAAELGNVTRNAVIGKVHRLGLSGRAKSPSSAAPRPRKALPVKAGTMRPAILAVILFFIVGALLLYFVNVGEGQRRAREEEEKARAA